MTERNELNSGNEDSAGSAPVEDEITPEAAFELVAHETRIAVLQTLQAAGGGPLSFGDIRERIGVTDPGQCHYHVDKLCDHFVWSTDDGYRLSPAGWQLVGALLSGSITATIDEETVAVGGSCTACGGDLVAHFRQSGVTIICTDCRFVQTDPDIPPALVEDWPSSELPEVVGRYTLQMEVDAAHGFCPNCRGRVSRGVVTPTDASAPDWFDGGTVEALVVTDCHRCGKWWHATPSVAALAEPAVVALYHDHGIDPREQPWWALDGLTIGSTTVRKDPLHVHVPIDLGDGKEVIFDEDFEFVETYE